MRRTGKGLAKRAELKVDGERIAFRWSDFNNRFRLSEGFGRENRLDVCSDQIAAVFGAAILGFAVNAVRGYFFLAIEEVEFDVAPEIRRTKANTGRRVGACSGGRAEERSVVVGEQDFETDADGFLFGPMIELRLLGAIVRLLAGMFDHQSEGSEERNGGDIRAAGWRRQVSGVSFEEGGHGIVVSLAEKVGFAYGAVRERRIECRTGDGKQRNGKKASEEPEPGKRHGAPLCFVRRERAARRLQMRRWMFGKSNHTFMPQK